VIDLSRHSRSLAVALLLLAVLAAASVIFGPPLALYYAQASNIEDGKQELATYRRLVSRKAELEQQLAGLSRRSAASKYYVQGATPALASANIQKYLNTIATRNGAEVISTQIVTAQSDAVDSEVSLRVHMRADIEAAMAILHSVESGRPMLFVDDLAINARPVRGRTPEDPPTVQLDMQFELKGYTGSTS
jgi:general secretion pathway protein M